MNLRKVVSQAGLARGFLSKGTEQWLSSTGWAFAPASEFIFTAHVARESPSAAWLNHHCTVSWSREDVWGARWKPRVDVRKTAGGVTALRSVSALPDVAGTFRFSSSNAVSPHHFLSLPPCVSVPFQLPQQYTMSNSASRRKSLFGIEFQRVRVHTKAWRQEHEAEGWHLEP